MKPHLLLYFSLGLCARVFTQDALRSGIIYGNNHAFSLTAPEGWVLDNTAAADQGIYAVFYREGESWQGAETVMYANTASLEDKAHRSIEELIRYDLDDFKQAYPDLEHTDGKPIAIQDSVTALVMYFSSATYRNVEAVAYIAANPQTGVMIVLSSRTQSGFDASLGAFEELVRSYNFLSDNVTIENVKD